MRRPSFPCTLVVLSLICLSGCSDDSPTGTAGTTQTSGGGSATDTAPIAPLTEAQFLLALQLKNTGVAALENLKFDQADREFTQLRQLLPQSELPIRNLAITRVLSIIDRTSPYSRSKNANAYDTAVQDAEAALESMRETVAGGSDEALVDLLAGKLAAHDDSAGNPRIEEAVALLTRAAEARPDQPEYWYALAAVMDEHHQLNRSLQLLQTLKKCRELAPENLFLLAKLVDAMAMGLSSPDTDIQSFCRSLPDELSGGVTMLGPLSSAIKQQRNIDVVAMISKAADSPDATASVGPAMMIKNLVVAELAGQIDRRFVDRNLLIYIQQEFDPLPELVPGVLDAVREMQQAIVLKAFTVEPGLPELSGVTQVDFADMNLDGVDDLVVAVAGKLSVYSRPQNIGGQWSELFSFEDADLPVEHFLLVDLNRDYDRVLSDVKSPALLRDPDGDLKTVTDPAGQHRWYDTALDVVMWNGKGVTIAHNQLQDDHSRKLVAVPQDHSVTEVNDVTPADIEADGDLDLVFATNDGMVLWRNVDGTRFDVWDSSVSLPNHDIVAVATVDWNRDMAMDVVGVSGDGRFGVLQNILHGRMRWMELPESEHATTGLTVADFNRDARWDAFIVGSPSHILTQDGRAVGTVDALGARASISADFDNDGRLDVVLIDAQDGSLQFHRGGPGGDFQHIRELTLPDGVLSGHATDIDDDGDLDLVTIVAADGSLQLLRNEGGSDNNWIDIVPRAVPNDPQFPSNRVNMHGIGAVIELRSGPNYQARVVDQPRMHFGLGTDETLDALRVTWTDGVPQNVIAPELLRSHVGVLAPQILMGSCPYIYTWTGERFEFFSDCLWAAPIGLVQATGDFAPTREWEHLLIPGQRLQQRDGRYVLQLTEELWETAYFDEVKLAAIDHPAGVTVLTNEKVGSPQMAAHRLHTVRHPVYPDAVADKHGRDLLPGLSKQDGEYVQPFDGRITQGLTDEWTMEFRCNLADDPESLRLVLVGWVFPTDTSLNVAIQQNPNLKPPFGPQIQVQDAEGKWQTAIPFIGFPGGKTKSIVIDLSDVVKDKDVHFRLRSSMELYFDEAWFIADETDEAVTVLDCPLATADLHFRGCSHRVYASNALFRNGHAPESYAWDDVITEPRWNPIGGRFTRYGPVADLVSAQDDRLVVMGPGDALTIEFQMPAEAVPDGWVRDFVLYNVGWDKDANLNTVYGQSSEPYPFAGMTSYPFGIEESLQHSADYQQYLERYQTRQNDPEELSRDVLLRGRANLSGN
jgi:FG-GAP-like repeat/ASPIC and UnbV